MKSYEIPMFSLFFDREIPIFSHMGLSENRVYSQLYPFKNGIMISKTIGFRSTNHFQTHPHFCHWNPIFPAFFYGIPQAPLGFPEATRAPRRRFGRRIRALRQHGRDVAQFQGLHQQGSTHLGDRYKVGPRPIAKLGNITTTTRVLWYL